MLRIEIEFKVYQECAERGHETLFYDVPDAAVLILVNSLIGDSVNVDR